MVHKTLFKTKKTTLEKKKRAQIPKNDFYQIKKAKMTKKLPIFPQYTKKGQKSSIKYSKGQEKNITKTKNDQKIVFLPK